MNKYKLNQLYEISSGISKSSDNFGFGNPFLSFSVVFNNFHIPEKLNDLINTTNNEINKFSIKRGDVFITRTSEKIEELGKSCVALKNYENATYNGFCKRLRPIVDESVILPEYTQYLFRTKQFTNQIIYSSPMSTRASLNEEILNSVSLNIHTLEEQQHIVDIIVHLIYSRFFYLKLHFLVAIFLIHLKLLLFFPLFLLESYRWNHQYQHIYPKLKNNHCL